ncbi:hypothetical protein ACFL43_05205 [Thermodesulfobacteriota bacterium]
MKPSFRLLLVLAHLLWAVPLLAGIGTLAGFRLMRDEMWLHAGIFLLPVGCAAMIAGLMCVLTFKLLNRAALPDQQRQIRRSCRVAAALLLGMLPAAAGCLALGSFWAGQLQLAVHNTSDRALSEVSIFSPRKSLLLGGIAPGTTRTVYFSPGSAGPVSISLSCGSQKRQAEITGYACGFYEDSRIIVADNCTVTILKAESGP